MTKEMIALLKDLTKAQEAAEEIMNKADATAEEVQACTDEIKKVKAKIDAQIALDEIDDRADSMPGPFSRRIGAEPEDGNSDAAYAKAFMNAICRRATRSDVETMKNQALSVNVPEDGGYVVPMGVHKADFRTAVF